MSVSFYSGTPNGVWDETLPTPNFSNDNARAVLSAMGIDAGEYLVANAEISTVIRGAIRALNSRSVEKHVRESYAEQIEGCAAVYIGGLDVDGIRERVERILDFAKLARERGYTLIWWG